MKAPNVQRYINKPVGDMSAKIMRLWQMKPKVFMTDNFEFKPDAWQEEAIDLYLHNQRLAMICSKGPGKTCLLALITWHFFLTNKLPKIAALSISSKNLKANLWAELAMWGSRSELVLRSAEVKSERITLNGFEKMSFIDARSFEKEADEHSQASALAGLHADNVAFVIDEGGDIPDAVIITADAALAGTDGVGKKARLLVAANPTTPSGLIYKASRGISAQKWATLHVSGDPNDPKRASRVSKEWAQALIDEYGIDNDYVKVNVFGLYPTTSSTQLLTEEEIDASCKRVIEPRNLKPYEVRMGVDVSRGGVDATILAIRQGRKVLKIIPLSSSCDSTEIATKIIFEAKDNKVDRVFVDDTGGYGSGVVDALKFQKNFTVEAINYASNARDKIHYFNIRSEMYVKMRDWVKSGGQLLPDPRLKSDLMSSTVMFMKGKFQMEAKEQIKKRLGRSPDRADALAMTFIDDHLELKSAFQPRLGGQGGNYVYKLEDVDNQRNYVSH